MFGLQFRSRPSRTQGSAVVLAFTDAEFDAGRWRTICYFCAAVPIAFTLPTLLSFEPGGSSLTSLASTIGGLLFVGVLFVAPTAGVITIVVALALGPLTKRIAKRLAARHGIAAHVAFFLTAGLTVGVTVVLLILLVIPVARWIWPFWVGIIPAAMLAPTLGWWTTIASKRRTMRRAPSRA